MYTSTAIPDLLLFDFYAWQDCQGSHELHITQAVGDFNDVLWAKGS